MPNIKSLSLSPTYSTEYIGEYGVVFVMLSKQQNTTYVGGGDDKISLNVCVFADINFSIKQYAEDDEEEEGKNVLLTFMITLSSLLHHWKNNIKKGFICMCVENFSIFSQGSLHVNIERVSWNMSRGLTNIV